MNVMANIDARAEKEKERLEKNRERRHKREKQKKLQAKGKGGSKATGVDGDGEGSPEPSTEKGTGTQRKCANCGKQGHIKTNKKYYCSDCPPEEFKHPSTWHVSAFEEPSVI